MSESYERVSATVHRVKVFPLPNVVMLPGGAVPLHIFEERYREMVRDALAGDGVFALAQVEPGGEGRLLGDPPLESLCCAGVIALHDQLEEGRYNIVVTGVVRARIISELPKMHLYREFAMELLPDDPAPTNADGPLREALLELMARIPGEVGERLAHVTNRVHGGLLADVVAAAVVSDMPRRYELLETLDPERRVVDVTEEVLNVVGRLKPKKPEGYLN